MTGFFVKWIINILALLVVVWVIPGISVDHLETAVLAAFVLGLLNAFLRPIIVYLTLPLQILSLGIFTLLINGFLFYLAGEMVKGFHVAGFASAFWGAFLFSIVSFLLNLFISSKGNISVHYQGYYSRPPERDENVIDVEGKVTDQSD